MDLLKKHYEKIVLGVVLLVLMAGAAMLPTMISRERDDLNKTAEEIINRPAKPLDPLDLSTNEIHLKQLKAGYSLDLSSSNKVFNSSQWQEAPDGRLIKLTTGREIGIEAVTVTKQTPLYLIISFDSVPGSSPDVGSFRNKTPGRLSNSTPALSFFLWPALSLSTTLSRSLVKASDSSAL